MGTVISVCGTDDYETRVRIDSWCREQFGEEKHIRDPRDLGNDALWTSKASDCNEREYSFFHEQDAVLFALKWK